MENLEVAVFVATQLHVVFAVVQVDVFVHMGLVVVPILLDVVELTRAFYCSSSNSLVTIVLLCSPEIIKSKAKCIRGKYLLKLGNKHRELLLLFVVQQ